MTETENRKTVREKEKHLKTSAAAKKIGKWMLSKGGARRRR